MNVPGVKRPYSHQSIQLAQRYFQAAVHPHVKVRCGVIYALQAQESLTLRLFCEFPWWRTPDSITSDEAKLKCDELTETGVRQFFSYIAGCRREVWHVMKYICTCALIAMHCVSEPETQRYKEVLEAAKSIPLTDDICVDENILDLAKLIHQSGIPLAELDTIITAEARCLNEMRCLKRFQKEHNEDIGWAMFDKAPFFQEPESFVPLNRSCAAVPPDAPLLPDLKSLQVLFDLELKLLVRREVLRKWPVLRPINYEEGEVQRAALLEKIAKSRQEMYPMDFPAPPASILLASERDSKPSVDQAEAEASDNKDESSSVPAARKKRTRGAESAVVVFQARRSTRQRTPSFKYVERSQKTAEPP